MNTRFLLFFVPFLLSLFLVACGVPTQESYQRALEQVNSPSEPEYYQNEVNRPVKQAVAPESTVKWIEELEKLAQMQQQQRSQALEPFYDFESPENIEYRRLAKSRDEMEARLAEPINLDLLLSLAYERNPGLQAAYRKIEAALEQYPQAAYLDNVLSQYNAFTKQLNTKIGPPRNKEMMAMKFPSPDMLTIKGHIVTQDVQLIQKDAEIVLRDLITDVRLVYYEYLFVHRALAITRDNQGLLDQMLQIATAKFRATSGNYPSILKAQVEFSKLSDSILTLEERKETLTARINSLLDRSPDAPLGSPEAPAHVEVTLPLEKLYALGIEHRQEIQKQKLAISKMELMIQMVRRMSTPDASTGASYFEDRTALRTGTQKMPPTFMNERTVNPRTSAWFAKDDAYVREVEVKVDAMERMIANMEDKTRFKVKLHHFGANTAKRTVVLYEHTLVPQAQQSLEAVNIAYQAGEVDFLNFLDAQRTLLMFSLEREKALWSHRRHTAQLEQTVGKELPKKRLDLNRVQ